MEIEWGNTRVEWSRAFEIGVASMDAEHRRLLELVNDFQTAVNEDGKVAKVEKAIIEVIEFAKTHFEHEEELMRTNGYEGLDSHIRVHAKLTAALDRMRENLYSGDRVKARADLLEFCKVFFSSHIPIIDSQYAREMPTASG